ncbi:coiled-coil domain-containing protein [Acetatifactor aquisgranensis]|uniref:hypothetical protein n=1 Tax=Acetatifactor aquisgranensis TaxID=2941233 RepID=UPI00203B582B|nr:hypothetical protein [Acetatifactor aquisgranensis]
MDMFMDKLAQKLTAQEIIKANTAADVEELNKLKNQIAEYNECLAKLQKLIDDGAGKLAGIQIEESELAHLVGESYGRMKMLQQDVENLQGTIEQQQERIDGMEKSAAVRMEAMSASVLNQLEALASQTEVLSATVGAKIDQLCGQLEAQATGGLSERLDQVEENVHKECVKVYRNVQAVMVEESGKQNEAMDGAKADVEAVKGKLGAVLGVSVAAAVLSLAGVLYQVLSGLHVLPF